MFLALLRSVNVGGKNRVEMAKLKGVFESLGFTKTKTFIASGNVLFESPITDHVMLVKKIESALESVFGIHINVLIRDTKSMKDLVNAIPESWANDTETKCDVMFLWKEIDNADVLKQLPYNPEIEDVMYVPGAIIWRIDRS